jgi:hypothetical protein
MSDMPPEPRLWARLRGQRANPGEGPAQNREEGGKAMAEFSGARSPVVIEHELTGPVPCSKCGELATGFKITGDIVAHVDDSQSSKPRQVVMLAILTLEVSFHPSKTEMVPCGCDAL